ncbi:hypothetical protein UlMin_041840 [Ulmus minor]
MANLHITMFPWFALGHITPCLHLANELAAKGHKVSILIPKNAQLLVQNLNLHLNLITFHSVIVPPVDGLPPGAETASDVDISFHGLLATAIDLTRPQVQDFLSTAKPDFVFYDFAPWIPQITKQLQIKSVYYCVFSAASMAFTYVPARNIPVGKPIRAEDLTEPPPGYPSSTVVLRDHEVRSVLLKMLPRPFGEGLTFYHRLRSSIESCDLICMRTCREIHGRFCDYIGTQFKKPILLTGPVLQAAIDPETADNLLEDRWAKWLSGFEKGSVVFCSLGSQQYDLDKDQFQELVLGFELTGLPFFLALKPPIGYETVEEALPEGFEERVRGRGVIYGAWIEQPLILILNHPSVGCFVNHCGFGSMWESLMSDNQIVLIPYISEQIMNCRLLVEELKVAVEVEREENYNKKRWFSKESLSRAIKSVMDKDCEVGIMLKQNHQKWREVFTEPGFMSEYIDKFVHDLERICESKVEDTDGDGRESI